MSKFVKNILSAKRLRYWIICVFLFCVASSFAQTADDNLQSKLSNIKTIQANYTQIVHVNRRTDIRSSGKMALAKPRHFLWHTLNPTVQWLIADGKRIWLYEPALEQVSVKSQARGVGGAVGIFLSENTKSLSKSFKITQENKDNKTYFVLNAKSAQAGFKQVTLTFDSARWVGLSFVDSLGQQTTINFTAVKINQNLPARLFQFKRPKGVDLVSQ